jgi:hypothetical protein
MEWGTKYNTALIIPENNTFGYFVSTKIKDSGYRRLYYSSYRGDVFEYVPLRDDEAPGFVTSSKTRPQILTKLEEMIRNKTLKVYSQRLYDQLQTFIWKGNRAEAMSGTLDDLVMALAIGGWLLDNSSSDIANPQKAALAYAMLQATSVSKRSSSELMASSMVSMANPRRGSNMLPQRQFSKFDQRQYAWLLK